MKGKDVAARPDVISVAADDASYLANDVGTFRSETKDGTGTLPTSREENKTWAAFSFIKALSAGSFTLGYSTFLSVFESSDAPEVDFVKTSVCTYSSNPATENRMPYQQQQDEHYLTVL